MFSASELANMRTAQDGHMMDTGYIQVRTASADSFGEMVETFTESVTATALGLDMRPGNERHGADMTVTTYDATARLPIATSIDVKDRIRVTKRFGETLGTPLVFEVSAPVQRGPSGVRVQLRKVNV